ncbi:MAG: M48 family peptidase, partial [Candidatus Hydrothermarchaeales archaeon]
PEFFLDFIMYHELLHTRHKIAYKNGRRSIHTRQFKREEKKFERYSKAEALMKKISRQKGTL